MTHTPSVVSVSNIVSRYFPFDVKEALDNALKSSRNKQSLYYNMSESDILETWRQARREGLIIHKEIENRIKHQQHPLSAASMLYEEFIKINNLTPLKNCCEVQLFDDIYSVKGKIDAVFVNPQNDVYIVDWKRSAKLHTHSRKKAFGILQNFPNTNYWKFSVQLNLYRFLFEQQYNIRVCRCFIVIINVNKCSYEVHDVPDMKEYIVGILCNLNNMRNG